MGKFVKVWLICALIFVASGSAFAQGVTRVCTQTIGANGSNNCVDVSGANPFPIQGNASGTPIPVVSKPGTYIPLGYQQISAATLATATPLTIPAGAVIALVIPEAAGVRWRDDGTAPTAAIGMIQSSGQPMTFSGAAELAALQFILQSGSPILDISYYK